MAINYAYAYAEIDDASHLCIGLYTSTRSDEAGPTNAGTTIISLPAYDDGYLMKYYIDGNWYEDAAGTIPWAPSSL